MKYPKFLLLLAAGWLLWSCAPGYSQCVGADCQWQNGQQRLSAEPAWRISGAETAPAPGSTLATRCLGNGNSSGATCRLRDTGSRRESGQRGRCGRFCGGCETGGACNAKR